MTIQFTAIYRDGAFHPEVPPELPEGTPVKLWIVTPPSARLVGEAAVEHLRGVATLFDPSTDRPEVTSENADKILYGKTGDPSDAR